MGMGSGGAPRRLPPELREKIFEALRIGVQRGYGYARIWRMLKEDGVEISKSTVGYWFHKTFPEGVKRRGGSLPRDLRIEMYPKILELRRQGLEYRKIREMIEEEYGVAPDSWTIRNWCKGIESPYGG